MGNRHWSIFAAAAGMCAATPVWAGELEAYWHFSGAFHPAVAHFPIALLVVAGVVELWRAVRGKKVPGDAGYTCLMLGAASAVVATVLGWANADHGGDFNGTQAKVLMLHRWMGTGVAVVAVVMAVIATRVRRGGDLSFVKRFGLLAGLLICAGLVGLTGSYGGKLTFGVDYYETVYNETIGAARQQREATASAATEKAERKVEKDAAAATTAAAKAGEKAGGPAGEAAGESASAASRGSDAAEPQPSAGTSGGAGDPDSEAVATVAGEAKATNGAAAARIRYAAEIKPIFAEHCIKCHGEGKQKAAYRMDTREFAMKAGDSGEAPIVPGKADESLLVKLIEGKGEYEDSMMPPKGVLLSAQQVALIRTWIDQGAVWEE